MMQLVPPVWRFLIVALLALPCVHLAAGEVVIADFTAADNRKGLDWNADSVEVSIGPRLVTEQSNAIVSTLTGVDQFH